MTNQDNSLNVESKMKNVNDKPNGPSEGDLKNRFKEGSIPLQTDFADLIDIADIGRRAVGQAPDQTNDPNSALELNDNGRLVVKINANSGLTADSDGVKVRANNGITVDSHGVGLDPNKVLPRGMIVMFSGSSVPTGWALCDGSQNTPNLIDRFIMGGKTQDINGKSLNLFLGDKSNKKFTFTSENQTVHITGTTEGHSLTEDENGMHTHIQGEAYYYTEFCNGKSYLRHNTTYVSAGASGLYEQTFSPYTFTSGKGNPHSHSINLISGEHNHSNNVTVPYYILAFIMKL
ncbi:tail fiber protein [Photorhabdus sp. RM323S]|uniref:tail fiber protein n=1 Tax=Photorhabdus sp. RM323S TaxID=3342828 RepID=UPI0036D831B8